MSRIKSLLALCLALAVLTACGVQKPEQGTAAEPPAEEIEVQGSTVPEVQEPPAGEMPEAEIEPEPEPQPKPEPEPEPEPEPRPEPPAPPPVEKLYYIKINCQANTVTVYTKDEAGNYTVPHKAMICSTGRATPQSGVYRIGYKWEWLGLFGDVFGYYVTQINGNILFHSVPYLEKYNPASLEYWEFDKLGTNASLGCIRLQLKDAIWVYNNAETIAAVEFYNAEDPGPLGKPAAPQISWNELCRNWDPTDPDPRNPWHAYYAENPLSPEEQEMLGPEAEFVDSNDGAIVPGETVPGQTAPEKTPSQGQAPGAAPSPDEGETGSEQEGAEGSTPGTDGDGTDGSDSESAAPGTAGDGTDGSDSESTAPGTAGDGADDPDAGADPSGQDPESEPESDPAGGDLPAAA